MAATICAILASQVTWSDYIDDMRRALGASAVARDLVNEAWWHCYSGNDHHALYGECEAMIRTGFDPS